MEEQIRILFVDDERNVLRSLERTFLDEEYEILTASSGNEGISLLQEISPVQVVISDYRMPQMNGVDFLREVRRRWPDTVRIVLSGYADTSVVIIECNSEAGNLLSINISRCIGIPGSQALPEAVTEFIELHREQKPGTGRFSINGFTTRVKVCFAQNADQTITTLLFDRDDSHV